MHLFALYIGTGALMLIIYLDKAKKHSYAYLFILFLLVFSFFEYVVGYVLDALFAERWWDYSNYKYNLNGRITPLNSTFWGIMTVLFVKFIYPLVNKFREKIIVKIPDSIQVIVSSVLVVGISIDFIISCINYLNPFL